MKNILFVILCLAGFIISCGHDRIIKENPKYDIRDIKNRIFFIIHGDGSYLYHDQNGNALYADEQALKYAIETAQNSPNSEVYIYHLKKKERFLFFFPKKDRDYYYFMNGKLVNKESYNSNEVFVDIKPVESRISLKKNYDNLRIDNYFFYYGHEIPLFDGAGYFNSFPERKFNVDSLSQTIKKLTEIINEKFQLIVLSTCNSGNPYTIYKMLPYSNYILASPGDLHLSYIDSRGITKGFSSSKSIEENINEFTSMVFDSLCSHTKTFAALSLYKNDILWPDLERFITSSNYLKAKDVVYTSELQDCSECQKDLLSLNLEKGTKVFYRPPVFGKMKNKKSHSGWGCYSDTTNRLTNK